MEMGKGKVILLTSGRLEIQTNHNFVKLDTGIIPGTLGSLIGSTTLERIE